MFGSVQKSKFYIACVTEMKCYDGQWTDRFTENWHCFFSRQDCRVLSKVWFEHVCWKSLELPLRTGNQVESNSIVRDKEGPRKLLLIKPLRGKGSIFELNSWEEITSHLIHVKILTAGKKNNHCYCLIPW